MKKSIGTRIKAVRENAREGKGISQADLAVLVGVNQTALSQIESGRTVPRRPTLIALSFILQDDFGEDWLKEFFKVSNEVKAKEFNYELLEEILFEANQLPKKEFQKMQPIWEMLKSEIQRRK